MLFSHAVVQRTHGVLGADCFLFVHPYMAGFPPLLRHVKHMFSYLDTTQVLLFVLHAAHMGVGAGRGGFTEGFMRHGTRTIQRLVLFRISQVYCGPARFRHDVFHRSTGPMI